MRKLFLLLFLCLPIFSESFAQEFPYTVNDEKNLSEIVAQAEASLHQSPQDQDALKTLGIALHNLARLNKDSTASQKAVTALEKALAQDPTDSMLMAYLGSSYAMLARDSRFVVNKVRYVNKGFSYLDRAVKDTPNDLRIRLVRGGVSFEVPGMFERRETAYEDYSFVAAALQSDSPPPMEPQIMAEVYYKLGRLNREKKQTEQAEHFFSQAIQSAPDSSWAALAQKEQKAQK